ncbi:glycosyltransferase [Sphingomonas sp. ID0503]|uniref:glycosyltransferase n=1 Tax=Sphingomonas sp. ID0503 TaxID=3399691 RepID=UPI003AFB4F7A
MRAPLARRHLRRLAPEGEWLVQAERSQIRRHLLILARAGRIPARLIAEAAEDLPAAVSLDLLDAGRIGHPRSRRLFRQFVSLYLANADPARAIAFGRAVLENTSDPADAQAVWMACPPLRDLAEARFEALAVDDAETWRMRARRLRKLERIDEAIAAYRGGLKRGGQIGPAMLAEVAHYAIRRGRYASDRDLVQEAWDFGLLDRSDPRTASFLNVDAADDAPAGAFAMLDRFIGDRPLYAPEDRILMIGNSLRAGGMERVLAASIAELRKETPVDLLLDDTTDPFFLSQTGLDETAIRPLASSRVTHRAIHALPVSWARRAQGAYDAITAMRPRVVHIWNDQLGLIGSFAALLAGCPRIVIHFHHMRPTRDADEARQSASWPACYRHLIDRPEIRLVFCSDAAARDYADWWGVAHSPRFHCLHNGFPPFTADNRAAARAHLRIPPDVPVIGTLTRFAEVKQPLLWIEAAAQIAAAIPGAHFVMAGSGPLLGEAREAIAQAQLTSRFRLPGRVTDIAMPLAAMDIAMMTSRSEGLPSAAIEAQLAGVPLVAFAAGGTGETIVEGVTGALVPSNDPAGLARTVVEWLGDPAALAEAGMAAKIHAASAFSMGRYVSELRKLYAA